MSYTPTSWKRGDVITAEKLNNMESGIVVGQELFIIHASNMPTPETPNTQPTLDKTFEEVANACTSGKIPLIVVSDEDTPNINGMVIPVHKIVGGQDGSINIILFQKGFATVNGLSGNFSYEMYDVMFNGVACMASTSTSEMAVVSS